MSGEKLQNRSVKHMKKSELELEDDLSDHLSMMTIPQTIEDCYMAIADFLGSLMAI